MRFTSFSPIVGSFACDARCPYCVSYMTPAFGLTHKEPQIDWDSFDWACRLAFETECKTVLFTGNGEPTLFPTMLEAYLERMKPWPFPQIELQTNGMGIGRGRISRARLEYWRRLGLGTICISVVHYDPEVNRQIYCPYKESYPDLHRTICLLKEIGFRIRLGCTMFSGGIDHPEKAAKLIEMVMAWGADELTLRPVTKPSTNRSDSTYRWTSDHELTAEMVNSIFSYVTERGEFIGLMEHGATLHRVGNLTVCLTNCLTVDTPDAETLRNLIFYPTGYVLTNWEGEGPNGILRNPSPVKHTPDCSPQSEASSSGDGQFSC